MSICPVTADGYGGTGNRLESGHYWREAGTIKTQNESRRGANHLYGHMRASHYGH
jgi:hypothetical protein